MRVEGYEEAWARLTAASSDEPRMRFVSLERYQSYLGPDFSFVLRGAFSGNSFLEPVEEVESMSYAAVVRSPSPGGALFEALGSLAARARHNAWVAYTAHARRVVDQWPSQQRRVEHER